MRTVPSQAQRGQVQRSANRGLALLIVGALVLIAVGLISIPLVVRQDPTLAPANTPAGTVQRFYQALYAGDYASAYSFLSADTQQALSLVELQQQLNVDLRNSQMLVRDTTITESHATVQIMVTHFQSGGIFGSNQWSMEEAVLLQREGESWKILSGPFYISTDAVR